QTGNKPEAVRPARHYDWDPVPFRERLQETERRISRRLVLPLIDAVDKQNQALVVIRLSHQRYEVGLILPTEPSFNRVNERALILVSGDELGPKREGNPYRKKV